MSHNDNIKIKFSGNDFFYVNAVMPGGEAEPTDARCAGLLSNQDLNTDTCKQGSNYTNSILEKADKCSNKILWKAFDENDDTEKNKIKPGNYAKFTNDGKFNIYDKDNNNLKTLGEVNNYYNNINYKGRLIVSKGNQNTNIKDRILFTIDGNNSDSSKKTIINLDLPDDLSTTLTFQSEIDKLSSERKEYPNRFLNSMDKIDINNSLYGINTLNNQNLPLFKLTFTEEGNLVLFYKTTSENISSCMLNTYDIVYDAVVGSFWQDNSGNCYKKEVCQNKEKALKLNDLENNHSGRDQNFINSQNIYSLELRRSIALSLGLVVLIFFGVKFKK